MKIHVVGQFSPPINGLSEALDKLITSKYLNDRYDLSTTDIKNNKLFFKNLFYIFRADADIYYFTISQTRMGNIRDMMYLVSMLLRGKKIIIHYHGGYYKTLYKNMTFIQKRINKYLLNKIDTMVVLSHGLTNLFSHIIPNDKITTCENFVSNNSFINETEFEKKLQRLNRKSKLEILYLSNFIKSKGYFEVLKSINSLKDRFDINVNFAGAFTNKSEEDDFFNFIKINQLDNYVTYHGTVKGTRKSELLKKTDLFILPTKYPKEGQPISILEAMANGCFVISTVHAGIPEIVAGKGILIKDNDSINIAEAVSEYMMMDEKSINHTLHAARKYIVNNFKEEDYLERLDKIFMSAVKEK